MTQLVQAPRAARQGAIVAIADFRGFYTWKTWLGGWLVRLLSQVAFYSLIGVMVGDSDYITYIVLGAALMICVLESMMAAASTTWDRHLGTFPLLVCSPVEPGFFYFGRSLMWPLSGATTTSIAIFAMSLFFDITWTATQVPMVLLLVLMTSLATYCMALTIGAAAMVMPGARNIMHTLTTMLATSFCGAVVPVEYWPTAIQWAAQAIPVTHGLEAVRGLEAGAGYATILSSAGLTVVAGAGWFLVSLAAFRALFITSRRSGALLD